MKYTFSDIYYQMNIKLIENDYYFANQLDKKELLEKALSEYMVEKLIQNHAAKFMIDNKPEVNTESLIDILGEVIPKEEHFNTLRHFTHFVLMNMSDIQSYEIIWEVSDENRLIDNPELIYNEDGYIDKLITHENTDYCKTFKFIYNHYQNNELKEIGKILTK